MSITQFSVRGMVEQGQRETMQRLFEGHIYYRHFSSQNSVDHIRVFFPATDGSYRECSIQFVRLLNRQIKVLETRITTWTPQALLAYLTEKESDGPLYWVEKDSEPYHAFTAHYQAALAANRSFSRVVKALFPPDEQKQSEE